MNRKQMALITAGVLSLAGMSYAESPLLATEQLGRPTDKSITLNVIAGFACDAYVKYGTESGVYTDSTAVQSFAADKPVVIDLAGLTENSKYFYRLCYKTTGTADFTIRDEHSFQTARTKGSTFSFNIIADAHLHDKKGNGDLMTLTMQNQLSTIPDFLIDMGDNFGDDHNPTTITGEQLRQNRFNLRKFYGMMCHSSPLFLVQGNHEGESGYWLNPTNAGTNQMALNACLWRKFYYNNPVPNDFYSGNSTVEGNGIDLPENYYSFVWGDAEFIILDAYRGYTASAKPKNWDWTLGQEQFAWFKSTLEKSTAKYKFVFNHHILGESRGGEAVAYNAEWGDSANFETNRPGWGGMPIHQLMKKYGVNIYFQGHDHIFAQEVVDGIVYQTCPMPADTSYMIGMTDNGDAFPNAIKMKGSGHLSITVSPDSLNVDFVTAVLPIHEDGTQKNDSTMFSYSVTGTGQVAVNSVAGKKAAGFSGIAITSNRILFRSQLSGSAKVSLFGLNGKLLTTQSIAISAGENSVMLPSGIAHTAAIVQIESAGVRNSQLVQISR